MRFSIGKLMALVAITAVNVSLAKVGANPGAAGVEEHFIFLVLFALPLADGLAVASMFRAPGRRSLDGFLLAGLASLVAFLAIERLAPRAWHRAGIEVANALIPLGNAGLARGLGRLTIGLLFYSLPPLALAAIGGRLYAARLTRRTPADEAGDLAHDD